MAAAISTRIAPSAQPSPRDPRRVARAFRRALDRGGRLLPAGEARREPSSLLSGYAPRYAVELFDTTFYLTDVRQNPDIRFFVAYVAQPSGRNGALEIHPRIFYKDLSLVWRCASHYIRSDAGAWIGKGDVKIEVRDGDEFVASAEETTDLPLEIQTALETLSRRARRIRNDTKALDLVLRRAPEGRIEPYRDFVDPRRRAARDPRNRVNRGRPIARFRRRNDPGSLVFVRGFAPDFGKGVFEMAVSKSRLYGGRLRRFRILSRNRLVQYLFLVGPRQVWIGSCQATTTELSSYGVRTVDAVADDDLLVPGFEYHYLDESRHPPVRVSQIPAGFAGAPSRHEASRADASPWLDQLPVIREFRRRVLGRGRSSRFPFLETLGGETGDFPRNGNREERPRSPLTRSRR